MVRSTRGLLALGAVAIVAVLVPAAPASAHPLGNFTVNEYSGLRVQPDRVLLDLVVDMAEIPTFQSRSDYDTNADGRTDPAEAAAYGSRTCAQQSDHLKLRVDGVAAPVRVTGSTLQFPPGQGGLVTLRLTCNLVAMSGALRGERRLEFRNANLGDIIELWATDPAAKPDVQTWAKRSGNEVVAMIEEKGYLRIQVRIVRKGPVRSPVQT